MESAKDPVRIMVFGGMLKKWVIYRCGTDLSLDDRDPTRTSGMLEGDLGYSSETTRSAAETHQDTPEQHRGASGCRKDTPDGYADFADTEGWGLQIIFFPQISAGRLRNFIANGYKRG